MFFSYALVIGVVVHIVCQVFKLFYYSFREGRLNLHYLVTPGGMPSTHSAFTGTVTLMLGFLKGFDSVFFALAFTFTAIVIYDTLRLRGAVQNHSDILLRLDERLPEGSRLTPEERKSIPRMVGHSLSEIVVGLVVAVVFSLAGLWFRGLFGV